MTKQSVANGRKSFCKQLDAMTYPYLEPPEHGIVLLINIVCCFAPIYPSRCSLQASSRLLEFKKPQTRNQSKLGGQKYYEEVSSVKVGKGQPAGQLGQQGGATEHCRAGQQKASRASGQVVDCIEQQRSD